MRRAPPPRAAAGPATAWPVRRPCGRHTSGWAPPGSARLQFSIVRYRIRSCATMPSSKLLIFSDIHTDWRTLERILSVEADFYISAGDLATWGQGTGSLRPNSTDARRKGLGTPRQPRIRCPDRRLLRAIRPPQFPRAAIRRRRVSRRRPRLLQPDSVRHPRRIHRGPDCRAACSLRRSAVRWCWSATPRPTAPRSIRSRPGLHAGSTAVRDFIERYQPAHFFCGHIHEAEGVSIEMGATRAHNVGKKAYLLELE